MREDRKLNGTPAMIGSIFAIIGIVLSASFSNAQRSTPWGVYETEVRQSISDDAQAHYEALTRTVESMPVQAQEIFAKRFVNERGIVDDQNVDIDAAPKFDVRSMKRLELQLDLIFGNGADLFEYIEANATKRD